MQREAAGIATANPTIILEAIIELEDAKQMKPLQHVQISHQIGAQSMALLRQTIELMNRFKHPTAVHIIKRQVPEFHAWKCQGRGIKTRTNAMKAKIENAG